MGRKRNKGKARKAKAAVAEEQRQQKHAEEFHVRERELEDWYRTEQQWHQSLARQFQQCLINNEPKCMHGFDKIDGACSQFAIAFRKSYYEAADGDDSLLPYLKAAQDATMVEYADLWNDPIKMEMAISYFLYLGTNNIKESDYFDAPVNAAIARYLEQHIAVKLRQTQALYNVTKIVEAYNPDMHTLVKFFRKRIPCTCLDEEYEGVKNITKTGWCFNPECVIPVEELERSKTMYCGRCRCVAYCSRECQRADWETHKNCCDTNSAIKAEFEAKHQCM